MDNQMMTIHRTWWAALIATLLLTATAATAAEKVTYYHLDALGSPVAATDFLGDVVWRETYQPYGERIQGSPAAADNARWYTGHVQDPDTGLVYAGARYYDPVIGRFYAADPVAFTEKNLHSFNRYAYGNNNPFKYIDPDGRDIVLAVDPNAASGNGHTTLYFQDVSGQWYSYNQGAAGYTSSGAGNAGFMSGLNAPAAAELSKVDVNEVPLIGNSLWIPTSSAQDAKISQSAVKSAQDHNTGASKYNLYRNNCTDAAVDVVNKSGANISLPNSWLTIRPNQWIKDAETWRDGRTFEKEILPIPTNNR